jgi:hypothetical protein
LALPTEVSQKILVKHSSARLRNLFAQASASYVLNEVKEKPENFPQFDPGLVDKVTTSAYAILAAGTSLHEENPSQQSIDAIEEAASLLVSLHLHRLETDPSSRHHILIASMAFYASGQYSRSFVTMKNSETFSRIAMLVGLFLRRNRRDLITVINGILLSKTDDFTCLSMVCEPAIERAIAQAMSHILEFQATGDRRHIDSSAESIDAGMQIASEMMSPALWWIARLLKLMIHGFDNSSPWSRLPFFFPDDHELLNKYIQLSAFSPRPVTELWRSQLDAIPIVLDRNRGGAVINMRTSAGKTRVAELAILQTIAADPSAKILYIAPYRSLALEIEQSLCQIFDWLGHRASHLYGGFRFSSIDRLVADEATITIATPEKARAIVRSSPEMLAAFRLIIVDEGHLIGANERLIRNELFLDHIRTVATSSGGRILLLSAVLPNPSDISHWISGSPDNVAKSEWKPSAERFGLLRWNGSKVRIDWRGEFESFNPNFIEAKPLGWSRRQNKFPDNKNEAIAATAIRLSSIGPVMIFSGRAISIPVLAQSVLLALGEHPDAHPWPPSLWDVFAAACREEWGGDTVEFRAAKHGIICHSNKLPPQVRMATERLMRSIPPKVIIATSTLAQGVNIGISSVIIASPYILKEPVTHRDFWNICGRAGRAFVDGEGKILYAIDETDKAWKVEKNRELAKMYFNTSTSDPVQSGLLFCLSGMRRLAESAGIDFEHLLTLVAENDFSSLGDNEKSFDYIYSMIDDALLALHEDPSVRAELADPNAIMDKVFRTSLASIQATSADHQMEPDDVVRTIQARLGFILSNCSDIEERRACVTSGLPYLCARNIYRDRLALKAAVDVLVSGEISSQIVIDLLEWIEDWSRANGDGVIEDWPEKDEFDKIRSGWINGTATSNLNLLSNDAANICKEIYGYQLPWIIHAGSQVLLKMGDKEHSEALSIVASLVEFGVPNTVAVTVFLAGIRSRAAACEIASLDEKWGVTPNVVRRQLSDPKISSRIEPRLSNDAKCWLRLLVSDNSAAAFQIPKFPAFTLPKEFGDPADTVLSRSFGDSVFLCTPDGRQRMAVEVNEKWPFATIADDLRFSFKLHNGKYRLDIRDPRLTVDPPID